MWLWLSLAVAGPVARGTFVPTLPTADVQARADAAVEAAAAEFPWALRSIARGRIAEQAHWCPRLSIDVDAARFRVACRGDAVVEVPVGATTPVTLPDGRRLRAEASATADTLSVVWHADNGLRRTVYRFSPDGTFVLHLAVESDQLPTPVVWSIPYQPAPP
jgi:hypothetical protein